MLKIISKTRLEGLEQTIATLKHEVERLSKVRPIADDFEQKGISVDDLLNCTVHLRRNPKRKPKEATS